MDLDAVRNSYARCLMREDFVDRFYDIFIDSHPSIRPMFENTDFDLQINLLRQGLMYAFEFARGDKRANTYIEQLRESHGRHGRIKVQPKLYPFWVNSMVTAASQCDPEFNPRLEKEWRNVLSKATAHMKSGY